MDDMYEKISKKIVDLFADGRITYADWNYIALYVVTKAREDYILNRLEHFGNAVTEHRQNIQFGRNENEQDTLF